MQWVSTENQLPREDELVMAWSTIDDDYVLAMLRDKDNWWCQSLGCYDYHTRSGISHWCKLPKKLEFALGELIDAKSISD